MYVRALATLLSQSTRSVLLLGPRQVGKSTLLHSLGPDLTLNLASPQTFREFVARPERLEQELLAAPPTTRTVFLDEVQRVPALLDVVQVILDEWPGRFRFLLSGSSARKLRRGHANLLPGRVHVHHLHPLDALELGTDFALDRVMAHGSLPGITAEPNAATRAADLMAYADTYLREEIQAEALVRNVGGYARLLELVAASSGRVLNLQSLSSDAGLRHETARRYVEVLEDTLVAFRFPAFSGSDRASAVAHPKLFLFDLGVRNALLRRPLDRVLIDDRGLSFEHLVAYELHRRCGSRWPEARLFHFRTHAGAEVDFVLDVGGETWAIEVKASTDVPNVRLAGFAALAERTEVKRKLVVYAGRRRLAVKGVDVLPFLDFVALLGRETPRHSP